MSFDYTTVDLNAILQRAYTQMSSLQRGGVGLARSNGRVLFNVWMGVGKTFMGLTSAFCFKPQVILFIGSKNSISGFKRQIRLWYPEFSSPDLFQEVLGTPSERQVAWKNPSALFFATSAASFIRDINWLLTMKVRFDVIIVDEPQKYGLRNRKSQAFQALKDLIKHIEKRFQIRLICFLTGTWTSKGPPQQWPILNILAPKEFKSYWQHVNTYCIVVKGPFGSEIAGPKNTAGLAQVISPYVYTVTEAMAAKELPPFQRLRLEADMPKDLERHYLTMLHELYMEHDDSITSVSTILASYTILRKMITCPALIDPKWGVGPAIEACVDKMRESDELPNWRHNLVFTPFLDAIPIFKDYLANELKMPPNNIITLQGGIDPAELMEKEERFRKDPNTLILASLKYGQSWNAETALNCYFPHFDWDQDENKQAEARSRRKDGTQHLIRGYYVNIEGTITSDMFDLLNRKEHNNKITYQDVERIRQRIAQRLGINK